ncbi:hypothetical protein M8C21_009537 [Ambrosia artemisiifolia]|uniref:EF-1-gamma C-terminal domain-containing protein n=1 Tax=Ambrosia artemisiifolia TaxID=4212 RepID=A0AAD5G7N6_AMBAR|nr:hypothetical protein M8C21_009537 [Ambrosia artemisiifolia]
MPKAELRRHHLSPVICQTLDQNRESKLVSDNRFSRSDSKGGDGGGVVFVTNHRVGSGKEERVRTAISRCQQTVQNGLKGRYYSLADPRSPSEIVIHDRQDRHDRRGSKEMDLDHIKKNFQVERIIADTLSKGLEVIEYLVKLQGLSYVEATCMNKVGGFLQRMDLVRKYAFGKMLIIGNETPFKIKGLWLFSGLEIPNFVMDRCYGMEL